MTEQTKLERRFLPIASMEIRASESDDGQPVIEGYSAVFNKWSEDLGYFREKIAPGAFKNALKASDVRCLFNHDANFILGRAKSGSLEMKEDGKGLWFRCTLPDAQDARDLYARIKRGDIDGCSFAFTTERAEWKFAEKQGEMDERTILEIREVFDVGPVVYPAYPSTSVSARDLEAAKAEYEALKNERDSQNTPVPEQRSEPDPAAPVTLPTPLREAAKIKLQEMNASEEARTEQALQARLEKHKPQSNE